MISDGWRPRRPDCEIEQAGYTDVAVYGVQGQGWPLRQEWADPQRREQVLFAALSAWHAVLVWGGKR
jgi:hypothetical protein